MTDDDYTPDPASTFSRGWREGQRSLLVQLQSLEEALANSDAEIERLRRANQELTERLKVQPPSNPYTARLTAIEELLKGIDEHIRGRKSP